MLIQKELRVHCYRTKLQAEGMKRASDTPPPPAKRGCDELYYKSASLIRLNVGGKHFDVAPATLSCSTFFEPLLAGRMSFATHEDGRIFIDRSGKMFEHVLQFLRCCTRPPQSVLDACGEELLLESEFYGIDWLGQHIRGEISPFDLLVNDRELMRQEEQARIDPKEFERKLLLDVFSVDMAHRPRHGLQLPILFDGAVRPTLSGTFSDFYKRLNAWSGNLIEELRGVPGLVFAGGATLSALVDGTAGDLDIFLIGTEEPEQRLRAIFAAVQKNQAARTGTRKSKMLVTRSKNAITIFRVLGGKPMESAPPVQVITSLYRSSLELLIGFDVDCCCFAFLADAQRVVCTPRGQRALQHGMNIADTGRCGPSYCRRLEKYARRGFAIAVPGFLPARVSKHLRTSGYVLLRKYDLLLKVAPRMPHNTKMEIPVSQYDGQLRAGPPDIANLKVNATQQGTSMRNMGRLVVLDRMNGVRVAETPELFFCEHHKRTSADDARMTGACVPVGAGAQGQYTLLWGTSVEETVESDVDDEGYEQTPLACVYSLLDKHFRHELGASDETPENDDGMWMGGAMHRLAGAMAHRDPMRVVRLAHEHQACRIQSSESLLFVYDFCTCAHTFEDLKFTRDASRYPLNSDLDDEQFGNIYGLPAKLLFELHKFRKAAAIDWWEGVY